MAKRVMAASAHVGNAVAPLDFQGLIAVVKPPVSAPMSMTAVTTLWAVLK